MPNGGREAKCTHGAHAADAEHDFLANARSLIAAVEPMRDVAVDGSILGTIRIEEINRHAPDFSPPNARHHIAPGDAHADGSPKSVRLPQRFDRQIARIMLAVLRALHAVVVDALSKEALTVQESHGHEIHALVARSLAVITCQHAQAPRVNRKALVKAVFRAEIADERRVGARRRRAQIGIECLEYLRVAGEVLRVARARVERVLTHATQHQPPVSSGLLPQLAVEILKKGACRTVPAEKQIGGELRQPRERTGDDRSDFEQWVSHTGAEVKGRQV